MIFDDQTLLIHLDFTTNIKKGSTLNLKIKRDEWMTENTTRVLKLFDIKHKIEENIIKCPPGEIHSRGM